MFFTKQAPSLFLLAVYLVFSTSIFAANMSSGNYKIHFGNINIGGKENSSATYRLDVSLGQTAAKKFTSTGYIVKAGFQYVHILYPFTFRLSDTSIDFGSILPNTPATQSLTVSISHRGQGYEVKAYEDHPLRRISGGNNIPDTSCNGGVQTCTETSANVWTSTSAYGFGYNASGNDITADFVDSTYYRPFADKSAAESAATFMSSNQAVKDRQATITMKVNVSPIDPAGTYQTVVNFIAVPKY